VPPSSGKNAEEARSSKTLVPINHSTQCNISEECTRNLETRRPKNLRPTMSEDTLQWWSLGTRKWTLGFHKARLSVYPAQQLSASQERSCSMESVRYK
jgi:hypothetical protein